VSRRVVVLALVALTLTPGTARAEAMDAVAGASLLSAVDGAFPEAGTLDGVLQLDRPADEAITITWVLEPGTAAEATDPDVPPEPQSLVIPIGSDHGIAVITVEDDFLAEGNETVRLRILDADNAVIVDPTATLTIIDDDPATRLPTPPRDVRAIEDTYRGTLGVMWSPPLGFGVAAPVGYGVYLRRNGRWTDRRFVDGSTNYVYFNHLVADGTYNAVVVAVNAAGWGALSRPERVVANGTGSVPGSGAIGPITSVSAREKGVVVSWTTNFPDSGEPATAYTIYVNDASGRLAVARDVPPDLRSAYSGDISPSARYRASVYTKTFYGYQGFGIDGTTFGGGPPIGPATAPLALEVAPGPTPVVRWNNVRDSGGAPVEGWRVLVVGVGTSGTISRDLGLHAHGFAVKGLIPGVPTLVSVAARTGAGVGAYRSITVTATAA
jgi:hypothetical protein